MSGNLKSADIQLIQRIIPHRYPFLLVDKVVEIANLESAIGIKNVTFNEPYFQGHFPGVPIMPGVVMIEALAQTAAVMVGVSLGLADKNLLIYFMGIDNCKFRRKVGPGETLEERDCTKAWVGESIPIVVLEENGGFSGNQHNLQRALGHAANAIAFQRMGDHVLAQSYANCFQPVCTNCVRLPVQSFFRVPVSPHCLPLRIIGVQLQPASAPVLEPLSMNL